MKDEPKIEEIEFLIDNGAEMRSPGRVFLYLAEKNNYGLMAFIADKTEVHRDELAQACAQNKISPMFSQSKKLLGLVGSNGDVLWSDPGVSPKQLQASGQYSHSRVTQCSRGPSDMAPNKELLMLVKAGPSMIADRESFLWPRLESLLASEQFDINHVYENCGGLKILEVAAVIGNENFIDYALEHCDLSEIALSEKYRLTRDLVASMDSDTGYRTVLPSFKKIYKKEVDKDLVPPQELNFTCLAHVESATKGRRVVKMQTTNLKGSVLAPTSKAPNPEVQEGQRDVVAAALLEMQEGSIPDGRK